MNNELDLLTPNESGVGRMDLASIHNTRNQNPKRSEFGEHDVWLSTAVDQGRSSGNADDAYGDGWYGGGGGWLMLMVVVGKVWCWGGWGRFGR